MFHFYLWMHLIDWKVKVKLGNRLRRSAGKYNNDTVPIWVWRGGGIRATECCCPSCLFVGFFLLKWSVWSYDGKHHVNVNMQYCWLGFCRMPRMLAQHVLCVVSVRPYITFADHVRGSSQQWTVAQEALYRSECGKLAISLKDVVISHKQYKIYRTYNRNYITSANGTISSDLE